MLNPEVARAQLQDLYQKDWRSQRVEHFSQLSESLQRIGCGLLGYENGQPPDQFDLEFNVEARSHVAFEQLTLNDRLQIFSVIFPKFSAIVEAAWQLISQLPYQSGYSRRSFRAPAHPECSATRRQDWLQQLIGNVSGYDQDLEWFAAWTPYLNYYAADPLGILFAAAINQNDAIGQAIFDILIASASGNHDIGAMGRHVTRALLVANRVEGWEFIERLLLAAQRQEGLRQTILETIDEAHPIAFRRMLRLILDQNLIRFSATIRAVDVWLGFGLESLDEKLAKRYIHQISELLESSNEQSALDSEDPQTVYLALWTAGFNDAIAAIKSAITLLNHPEATHRFVAVHFLAQLQITPARLAMLPALTDPDLRVSTAAIETLTYTGDAIVHQSDAFERLEQALPKFPAKSTTISVVWDWIKLEASQSVVANALVQNLGDRSPKRLIPYLAQLNASGRVHVARLLSELQPWDSEIRATLFNLVGDTSSWVRESTIRYLHNCSITPDETLGLEQLLARKASDLRRGILGLLLNLEDQAAIASAERLIEAKQALQRQAGLELLRELVQQNRRIDQARSLAVQYEMRPKLTITETQLLNGILRSQSEATLLDALGLVQLEDLTPIQPPQVLTAPVLSTPAAIACLKALDDLIHDHRQTPVKLINDEEDLLGNLGWRFPHFDARLSHDENISRLPLSDVWLNWYHDRSDDLRDPDGLELLRAIAPRFDSREFDPNAESDDLVDHAQAALQAFSIEPPLLRYPNQVRQIIEWLLQLDRPTSAFSVLLDAIAYLFEQPAIVEFIQNSPQHYNQRYWNLEWNLKSYFDQWFYLARSYQPWNQPDQLVRWWHLLRWVAPRLNTYSAGAVSLWDVFNAYQARGATEADLMFHLVGASDPVQPGQTPANSAEAKANLRTYFGDLSQLTRRKISDEYTVHPILLELGDRARQRILAIELQRGDLPTAASNAARALKSITGIAVVIQLLQAFDRGKLVRHYSYNNLSKSAVLSHLMRISFPAAEDTPAEFALRVQSAQIKPESLIQFAFYAPQWTNYVEAAIGWNDFSEAVWWFHAHTKDNGWTVEADVRETWVAQISERTPLTAQSLVDGAVDVEWFHRLYKTLKADRWQQLYEAAQYASSGAGHQRAKLFADAMLGKLDAQSLRDRIVQKRHQDSVRALGLLPLPKGKKRDGEILDRYQALQTFLRTSKKFGSQRQASEKLAVTIGLENLARTAGFVDPQRLQWAMEAQAIADLVDRAQTVTIDQTSVSLSITAEGDPKITVIKQGKPLKAIPAKLKKQPEIQVLTARKQDIVQQASRIRLSLEQAMCRGDYFTATELIQLAKHPVLAPMLSQLVLIGDCEIGYLVDQGTALQNHSGMTVPISSALRIAHPYDLLITDEWPLWQQDCLVRDRVQPFKQIFRELYVPTAAEQTEPVSRRYEGHQINPRQALALFGQRGWIAAPEEGVRRTFHAEGLIAEVDFLHGFYTPLEVEGLTIATVRFYRRDHWKSLPLVEIPPRLFSETMRDLDLVVSVAHQGGVDPEATASTVEMRSALVRETCRLLKLNNVQIQSAHALIEGQLGSYSVHLGSAIVHRQPGGALCIVPVHAQQRGRVFLPFVDNDPKTAEVVSKVLLLARDQDIQDPTILQQIL